MEIIPKLFIFLHKSNKITFGNIFMGGSKIMNEKKNLIIQMLEKIDDENYLNYLIELMKNLTT